MLQAIAVVSNGLFFRSKPGHGKQGQEVPPQVARAGLERLLWFGMHFLADVPTQIKSSKVISKMKSGCKPRFASVPTSSAFTGSMLGIFCTGIAYPHLSNVAWITTDDTGGM